MEDVLDVYERPEDPKRPLVCMDECPKQLIGETRTPLPIEPGQPERFNSEYVRNGTCNLFMFNAPLLGWRRAEVTESRTMQDWAQQVRQLVEDDFPDAEKIVLVMDNLNTHRPASLYETFDPERAKKIWDKLEIHHTPKHGSWLNMAEIEFGSLTRSGLSDRVPNMESMRREVAEWVVRKNAESGKIDWRFTSKDARIKLKRLYPKLQV